MRLARMGCEPAMTAIESEAAELIAMADSLSMKAPHLATGIEALQSEFRGNQAAAPHPVDAERAAGAFTFRLRSLWLQNAASIAAQTWRSPTAAQVARLERGPHDAFGYERDLRPEALEKRCADYFPKVSGWSADHVLASSGQGAMALALLALCDGQPLRLAHLGSYFETRELIRQSPAIVRPAPADVADVLLAEPVSCDGAFQTLDLTAVLRGRTPQALIVDSTLSGGADGLAALLERLPNAPPLVLGVTSTLKLIQGGFELANAGVVSVYARQDAPTFANCLRSLRTLIGAGLAEVDAIALEAPWYLDSVFAGEYQAAIFAHNAALACAVEANNARFETAVHPAFKGGAAPYCAFRLADPDDDAYAALEQEIETEAASRRLELDKGGSFGFRDHRFEVVRPEAGDAPFLRVAMGRRGGWSCDGIVEMMGMLAGRA
jgi:hypothetical protein